MREDSEVLCCINFGCAIFGAGSPKCAPNYTLTKIGIRAKVEIVPEVLSILGSPRDHQEGFLVHRTEV